jgi:hypothetical protein
MARRTVSRLRDRPTARDEISDGEEFYAPLEGGKKKRDRLER